MAEPCFGDYRSRMERGSWRQPTSSLRRRPLIGGYVGYACLSSSTVTSVTLCRDGHVCVSVELRHSLSLACSDLHGHAVSVSV